MNVFKRGLKKARKAVGFVSYGLSQVDPTYSKGFIGRYTYPIARPAVATASLGLIGPLALASPMVRENAMRGYEIGAGIGAAAKAGGKLGAISQTAKAVGSQYQTVSMTDGGTVRGEPESYQQQDPQGVKQSALFLALIAGGIVLLMWKEKR